MPVVNDLTSADDVDTLVDLDTTTILTDELPAVVVARIFPLRIPLH